MEIIVLTVSCSQDQPYILHKQPEGTMGGWKDEAIKELTSFISLFKKKTNRNKALDDPHRCSVVPKHTSFWILPGDK